VDTRRAPRGIPPPLVRWIDAFSSERTATILVNGHISEQQTLPQAGLPQGSPLSPILFLFFNADLVQHKLGVREGSMAFVDDYSAWATGPSAEANREGIQAIINKAMDWERRSGATDKCQCGYGRQTVQHILLECTGCGQASFHALTSNAFSVARQWQYKQPR
jgi:hypothetical protein